jgi:hypothetical protein
MGDGEGIWVSGVRGIGLERWSTELLLLEVTTANAGRSADTPAPAPAPVTELTFVVEDDDGASSTVHDEIDTDFGNANNWSSRDLFIEVLVDGEGVASSARSGCDK